MMSFLTNLVRGASVAAKKARRQGVEGRRARGAGRARGASRTSGQSSLAELVAPAEPVAPASRSSREPSRPARSWVEPAAGRASGAGRASDAVARGAGAAPAVPACSRRSGGVVLRRHKRPGAEVAATKPKDQPMRSTYRRAGGRPRGRTAQEIVAKTGEAEKLAAPSPNWRRDWAKVLSLGRNASTLHAMAVVTSRQNRSTSRRLDAHSTSPDALPGGTRSATSNDSTPWNRSTPAEGSKIRPASSSPRDDELRAHEHGARCRRCCPRTAQVLVLIGVELKMNMPTGTRGPPATRTPSSWPRAPSRGRLREAGGSPHHPGAGNR